MSRTIYQHPLAYLLGLEGLALLRGFAGEYDREFTLARLAEVRELLGRADEFGGGVEETPIPVEEGYAQWAPFYDQPGNELLEAEEPVVRGLLDRLPVGVALDAACGTGRHAAHLAALGHEVIGVDSTPEMLEVARAKLPEADFRAGDLGDLPLDDASVAVAVCAIAVNHVPELAPVLAELARVLRPGGHLILSDSRGLIGDIGLPHARIRPDGTFGYMPNHARSATEYVTAALGAGLEIRGCTELLRRSPLVDADGNDPTDPDIPVHVPGEPPYVWSLHRFAPEAANPAWRGSPHVIVWHLGRP